MLCESWPTVLLLTLLTQFCLLFYERLRSLVINISDGSVLANPSTFKRFGLNLQKVCTFCYKRLSYIFLLRCLTKKSFDLLNKLFPVTDAEKENFEWRQKLINCIAVLY